MHHDTWEVERDAGTGWEGEADGGVRVSGEAGEIDGGVRLHGPMESLVGGANQCGGAV